MNNFSKPTGATLKEVKEEGDIIYIWYAAIGAEASDPTSLINKIDTSIGVVSSWAEGAWSDYLTLEYVQ